MADFQTSPHSARTDVDPLLTDDAPSVWLTPRPLSCVWCGQRGTFPPAPQVIVEVDCVLERWRCGACRGEVTTPIPRSTYEHAVAVHASWPQRGCG